MERTTKATGGWRRGMMVGAVVALAAAACAPQGQAIVTPRAALDLPNRFEPLDPSARTWPSDTLIGSGCLAALQDPRDGYEIRAARKGESQGVADFRIGDGRYGVRPGELLRVRCNTGQPVGVVGWGE